MKNKFLTALCAFSLLSLASCSDDSSDEFNRANGDVAKKYITNLNYTDLSSPQDSKNFTVTYDADGKVIKASDGVEISVFSYSGSDLQKISDSNDVLAMTELTQPHHKAYEIGEVITYDNVGNPVMLRAFDRYYDGSISEEYRVEINYDDKPNPFFYTLEAAGIIKVLDNVNLNFSMTPQAEQLVKAKLLLPLNNPQKVIVRSLDGTVKSEVTTSYVYGKDKYPTSATFTEVNENGSHVSTAVYSYK